MIYLILLLFFEIIMFFIAFAITHKDILSPSSVMCLMFIVSTVFAIINADKWSIQYSFEACMILSSGIFVFLLTEAAVIVLTRTKKAQNTVSTMAEPYNPNVRNWVLKAFILFNLAISAWYFIEIRRIVGSTSSIGAMFSRYRNLGVDNMAGVDSERVGGILNQLLKIVKATGYVGVFLLADSMFFFKGKKRRRNILLLLTCITSLFPVVMVASRGGILMFFSDIVIVFYIMWHQKNGWNRNLSWKVFRYGVIGIITGIPAFYYSAFLMGRKNTLDVFDYVSTYVGGSIQLFNLYLADPIPRHGFGEETLASFSKVLNVLGLGNASNSYNLENRYLGSIQSNVYGFFRRPLHDYGLFGMYIFVIAVAILLCGIYHSKIKWRARNFKFDCWVLVYGYLYYWLIISSIEQYSSSYISVGCVLTIMTLMIVYWLATKVRFEWSS